MTDAAFESAEPDTVPVILRRLRRESALSVSGLAERFGISVAELTDFESGQAVPTAAQRLRMVQFMESSSHVRNSKSGPLVHGSHGAELSEKAPETAASTAGTEASGDVEVVRLRARVAEHLEQQGFRLLPTGLIAPVANGKDDLRSLHHEAVKALRNRGQAALAKREPAFIERLAAGIDVAPSRIRPRLVPVDTYRSADAPLWRWCSLHWSVPVSGGYGRRLRFLVVDAAHNDAVMGLIGLADPVYALNSRDQTIGWNADQRGERLTSVMDAFVLGAVPPYSDLLGGKLMAMIAGSREVRETFADRYGHRETLIAGRDPHAQLALITTSSALGRSSVYNRVRRRDGSLVMHPVGFTRGSGDFHFSGDIYEELAAFAMERSAGATHRHERWGAPGFRNRREVIQKALQAMGLPSRAMRFHGVQREVFLNPLARNSYAYLRGEAEELDFFDDSADDVAAFWRERWAVPRSQRDTSWLAFDPNTWRLYT